MAKSPLCLQQAHSGPWIEHFIPCSDNGVGWSARLLPPLTAILVLVAPIRTIHKPIALELCVDAKTRRVAHKLRLLRAGVGAVAFVRTVVTVAG